MQNSTKTGTGIVIAIILAISIILATFFSPFASSSPDGLEKVAEAKGFLESANEENAAWKSSPMAGYAVPGISNEKVATGASGFVGVIITFAVGIILAKAISKKKEGAHEEN